MASGLPARRKILLAVSTLATLGVVFLGTTGPAVAADRLVLAENFSRTT